MWIATVSSITGLHSLGSTPSSTVVGYNARQSIHTGDCNIAIGRHPQNEEYFTRPGLPQPVENLIFEEIKKLGCCNGGKYWYKVGPYWIRVKRRGIYNYRVQVWELTPRPRRVFCCSALTYYPVFTLSRVKRLNSALHELLAYNNPGGMEI